jgi:DNA polymerase-3 subunit delta
MVAYKSSAVASFIKAPKAECRAVLVYGPDAGLVAERADALAQVFAKRGRGQTEIVRLDDRDLAEDPARLEVELRTIPMFADQSVVRVAAGPKLDVPRNFARGDSIS